METLGRGEGILQAIYAFVVVFYAVIGTLRPDLIESASSLASSKADAIKTHHNDTELVRNLRAKVSAQKIFEIFLRKVARFLQTPDVCKRLIGL